MVALEAQGIMGALAQHRLGHRRMAMQGVGGHRAAFQHQGLEQAERRLDLVAARRTGLAIASRVSASHTLTISGGMKARPLS